MGMAIPRVGPPIEAPFGPPESPSAEYLASQVWTPDRVQNELVCEFWHWPRYELVDGELLVSPGAQWDHQRIVVELMIALHPYVERHALGEVLTAPADVRLTPTTTVQPDVFVVPPSGGSGGRDWRDISALSLVVEVLSPSTARYDRMTKRAFYAARGVPEYWVADHSARRVEVARPGVESVEAYDYVLCWHPDGAPEPLVIDVAALFERVWRRTHD